MIIELDGRKLLTESDFHDALVDALDLSEYYGMNLAALEDVLNHDVSRPLDLIWLNAHASKRSMGERFTAIVTVLQRVEREDIDIGYATRFRLILK